MMPLNQVPPPKPLTRNTILMGLLPLILLLPAMVGCETKKHCISGMLVSVELVKNKSDNRYQRWRTLHFEDGIKCVVNNRQQFPLYINSYVRLTYNGQCRNDRLSYELLDIQRLQPPPNIKDDEPKQEKDE